MSLSFKNHSLESTWLRPFSETKWLLRVIRFHKTKSFFWSTKNTERNGVTEQREREIDRQTDRQTDRDRQTETERDRDREITVEMVRWC